ncbi:hypothetical protein NA57DRAFT_72050 [Rhizodiscina lignyota]|uniref:Nascent polypeptide-associated complex subunit alpha-like UBA domain-containing protein n=1 Tax=Rhizodiscina lignyota TaxID=1504668 RepID=A0A9P4IPL2_9PEZI|nr:hypothetical protein NA57DRAFT_72050 [Rhizodiscina lignyota]
MAEEPQPSTVQEGATEDAPAVPASAEERKTAAALSKLEATGDDNTAPKKDVDADAIAKAMQNLDVGDKAKAPEKKEEVKKVKIDATDVGLLVDELLLSKTKATDLLKAHDGDAVKAMTAFVTAAV